MFGLNREKWKEEEERTLPDHVTGTVGVHEEDKDTEQEGGALGVDAVEDKFDGVIVGVGVHDRAEFEEDVCCHGVDPEHEGCEGVEGDIAGDDTSKGVGGHETGEVSAEIAANKTDVCNEIVDDKAESDLAEERSVEIGINDVNKEGEEKED